MKKNLFLIALTAMIMMVGCTKNSTVTVNGVEVPKAIVDKFNKQYPNAQNVKWSARAPYTIASFDLGATKAATDGSTNTAWYDDAANCKMEELDVTINELPQAVQDAFKACAYADLKVDDIDMITRDGFAKVYVIEVEGKAADGSEIDLDLYFSEEGVLLKEVPDSEEDDDDDKYDTMISDVDLAKFDSFLKERFGEYELVEADKEDDGTFEIEILIKRENVQIKIEVVFNKDAAFMFDVEEVAIDKAPVAVKDYITTKYKDQDVDEVDIVNTAEKKTYYVFEIEIEENGKEIEKDIVLEINAEGAAVEVEMK